MSTTITRTEVDHTPGGSPVGKSARAPIYRTVNVRAELLGATAHSGEMVDADHVWRTAKAATAMGMRNADRYGAEDRADVAAEVVSRLWTKAGESAILCRRCYTAPAAVMAELESDTPGVTATVPLCHRHATGRISGRPLMSNLPAIPADGATFTHALNHVANLRRSLDAQRERDAVDAAARVTVDIDPELETVGAPAGPDVVGTPMGAYLTAREIMRTAGLCADFPAASPVWTLVYTAARTATAEVDSEAIGAELEISGATVRQHCKRGAKRLAQNSKLTRDAWLDALSVQTTPDYIRKGAAGLPSSAKGDAVKDDWRTSGAQRVANVADSARPEHKIAQRQTDPNPSDGPAEWTNYLSAITAARMARSAELRDARSAAKSDAEREAIRRTAGL